MAKTGSGSEYFLSASQETSSRSRLFRPKELREFVFPGVGMIMHSLFWVKHTAYLYQLGADPLDQPNLMVYATHDGRPLYDESLLWYCLASRMDSNSTVSLTAGIKIVKNWLFEPQYEYDGDIYDRVADELSRMQSVGTAYDCDRFIEDVFAQWFVTRCRELDVDLIDRLHSTVVSAAQERESLQEGYEPVVSAFCELVGSLIREYDSLRNQGNLTVIGSTTRFAAQLLVPENEAEIETLADTSLYITSEQATALLRAVSAIDHGRHFIRSVIFIIYIDPTVQSGDEFSQEMRRIHDLVSSDAETIIDTAAGKVDIDALPSVITQELAETSYYWLLNFFMADGETIARTLLDTEKPVIDNTDIEAYFEHDRDRAGEFHDFLTRPEDAAEYLPRMLSEISADDSPRIHRFLTQLQVSIDEGASPSEALVDLLEVNGTIEQETEETYRIREYPSNTNTASFYGINPLRNWTTTILATYES